LYDTVGINPGSQFVDDAGLPMGFRDVHKIIAFFLLKHYRVTSQLSENTIIIFDLFFYVPGINKITPNDHFQSSYSISNQARQIDEG